VPPGMFRNLLVTVVVLLIAMLFVDVSADILQAWAVKEHNERVQNWLIRTLWVDAPRIGVSGSTT
jgi:hypothetical protein